MRIPTRIIIVAAGILLLVSASAQDRRNPANQAAVQKSADKVKELQRERIAALKLAADIETSLHRIGKTSSEAVLEAKVLACEAELDAAEKESDRIALLKNLVEVLKQCEEVATARKNSAEGTESAILKARARRLEAEIRLEQAQEQPQRQGQAKSVEPELEQEQVVVTSVQAKDVVITEQFACQIHSRRHIDVRSLQSGYLEEIQVREGQAVKQGDVMFQIGPQLYKAKLDIELAEVELATLHLKNTERLSQKKVVSEDELALSKSKLNGALAKAKLAQAELGLTLVRAPFDGIIDRLHQQVGSLVTERETLTTLSDNSVMWVYFNLPQTRYLEYMSSPERDREVEVELVFAGDRKFPHSGKIAAIEAQFNKETGSIACRADFPNPDRLLRHGMAGLLLIHRTLKSALVIPQRATFEMDGKRYVYVVDEKDMAHLREIVIQSATADDFVLQKGLDVNDKIVLEGTRQIQDGEKVEYEFRKP